MGVYQRPGTRYWWLYLETGKRREATKIVVGTTTAQRRESRRLAEDRYHQRMSELAARLYKLPSAQPSIRFRKYAESYEHVIAQHKGAGRERELLTHLVAFFGDDQLDAIDTERVRAYMAHRAATAYRGRKVQPSTFNREVDLLKSMLRDAAPKYLNASPIAGLKRIRGTTPKRRLMTDAEETTLLAACETPQDRAIIILGVDTLLRMGDLLALKRTDRDGSWLYVGATKNDRPVEVALSPRAGAALSAITHDRPYFFEQFRRAENPRDWPGAVRQRLELLCRKAKLPYGKTAGGLTFHWATRRTGATRLLIAKGVSVPVVQRLGNWKSPDVLLQIYSEAQRADLLAAVGSAPEPAQTVHNGRKKPPKSHAKRKVR